MIALSLPETTSDSIDGAGHLSSEECQRHDPPEPLNWSMCEIASKSDPPVSERVLLILRANPFAEWGSRFASNRDPTKNPLFRNEIKAL